MNSPQAAILFFCIAQAALLQAAVVIHIDTTQQPSTLASTASLPPSQPQTVTPVHKEEESKTTQTPPTTQASSPIPTEEEKTETRPPTLPQAVVTATPTPVPTKYKYNLNQSGSTCVLKKRRYIPVEYRGCWPSYTVANTCEGSAISTNFYSQNSTIIKNAVVTFENTISACCKPARTRNKRVEVDFFCNGRWETHTMYFKQPRSCELQIDGRAKVLHVQHH